MLALNFVKSETWITLKFSLSILTKYPVVCFPNKVIPFAFKCAAMWAGPVSLAMTNELSLINDDNCKISKALLLSKIQCAFIFFASKISFGPGATTIWYLFSNFSLNRSMSSL